MWCLYILECQNGDLYTGISDNLQRRLKEHLSGKGGRYTEYNRPTKMLYTEHFDSLLNAEKREQQIKRWSKSKKLALIRGDKQALKRLSVSRD